MPNSIDFYKGIFLRVIPVYIIFPCLDETTEHETRESLPGRAHSESQNLQWVLGRF